MVSYCVQVPVIPFAGGTSLEGQTMTPYKGVSINMNSMKVRMCGLTVLLNKSMFFVEVCCIFFEGK